MVLSVITMLIETIMYVIATSCRHFRQILLRLIHQILIRLLLLLINLINTILLLAKLTARLTRLAMSFGPLVILFFAKEQKRPGWLIHRVVELALIVDTGERMFGVRFAGLATRVVPGRVVVAVGGLDFARVVIASLGCGWCGRSLEASLVGQLCLLLEWVGWVVASLKGWVTIVEQAPLGKVGFVHHVVIPVAVVVVFVDFICKIVFHQAAGILKMKQNFFFRHNFCQLLTIIIVLIVWDSMSIPNH